jgi:hypothetical protein
MHVDADGTGKLDATPIMVEPNLVRGKVWTSFQALGEGGAGDVSG